MMQLEAGNPVAMGLCSAPPCPQALGTDPQVFKGSPSLQIPGTNLSLKYVYMILRYLRETGSALFTGTGDKLNYY